MAHQTEIVVNGQTVEVTEFDHTAQEIDDGITNLSTITGGATTPQAALNALGAGVRPNLLDNAIFIGGGSQQGGGQLPVNQRGQTSYTAQGGIFDRWKFYYTAGCTGKIDLLAEGIQVTTTGGSQISDYTNFQQALYTTIDTSKEICVSVIVDGVLHQSCGKIPVTVPLGGANRAELHSNEFRFILLSGSTYKIQAVKVEYGTTQTLAYQDDTGAWQLLPQPESDYATQLAKCQRYLIPIGANSCWGLAESNTTAYLYLPLPVSMRTTPVFQGNLPPTLWPGGNSVTSISVFSPSAIENMITLQVDGTGFVARNVYSLNQPIGFLSAEL